MNDFYILDFIKIYANGNEQQFYSAAMQFAANEARKGNGKLAVEIRDLIDKAKIQSSKQKKESGDDESRLVSYPDTKLTEMILSPEVESKLKRILIEQKQRSRLQEYNLFPRRKILLVGTHGSGKTMTANALAGELQIPLFTVISGNLKSTFEKISATRGVYFFDKVNFSCSLNSFLISLKNDCSESLIVVAVNNQKSLDENFFEGFDEVIEYTLPTKEMIYRFLATRLILFDVQWKDWSEILNAAQQLSPADLIRAADEAAKKAVLSSTKKIEKDSLLSAIVRQRHPLNLS